MGYARLCFVLAVSLFTALGALAAPEASPRSRDFIFHYAFTVHNVPREKPLRIWIPLAHSDPWQQVEVLSIHGAIPLKQYREKEYGNLLLYGSAPRAARPDYDFEVLYRVTRHEHSAESAGNARESRRRLERYLQPDKLVPVTGRPADLAAKSVAGKTTLTAQARAIYDYVFDNMRYDKTGTGWGRGDTLFACDSKRGNCTDFHSLFISMARAQMIPARFEIGFSIPPDAASGEVAGYHCWASFWDPQRGWVPVDISEAWKHPEKRDYFFGRHDADRMQFTMGRDLTLTPQPDGAALNYFVYPYVESDGKAVSNVALHFTYEAAGAEARTKK